MLIFGMRRNLSHTLSFEKFQLLDGIIIILEP